MHPGRANRSVAQKLAREAPSFQALARYLKHHRAQGLSFHAGPDVPPTSFSDTERIRYRAPVACRQSHATRHA
jgi:hypothetical protein